MTAGMHAVVEVIFLCITVRPLQYHCLIWTLRAVQNRLFSAFALHRMMN